MRRRNGASINLYGKLIYEACYIMLLIPKKSLLSAFVRPRPKTTDNYLPSCKTSSSRLSKNSIDERCHRHVWSSAESNRKFCSSDCLSNNSDIQKNFFQSRGANRDRTGNLLVANQALSQLSYSPVISVVVAFAFRGPKWS